MRHYTIAVDIAAPPERVWAVMRDVDRWPEWTPGIRGVTWVRGNGVAVGNRVLIRQPKLPPALWTVTAVDPERGFTWESVGPGLRAEARHTVETFGSGTRATLSIELHGLLSALWGRLTREITQRYVALEARGLKARSENPAFRYHT